MSHRQRFLGLPFFLSLVGVLFSLWNLWGDSSALCLTEGCSLFQDFTLAGVSIWWLGLVGFALLLLTAIPGFAHAGLCMAGIGLALDSGLLLIMLLTASCFNCLLIGGLLGLSFMAYRTAWREEQRIRRSSGLSPLLCLWSLLFVLNIGALINAEADPWSLPRSGPDTADEASAPGSPGSSDASEAPLQVYFSPSCPACLDLVRAAGQGGQGGQGGQTGRGRLIGPNRALTNIAWHPVAESDRDLWVIAALKRRMEGGEALSPALTAALAETPSNPDPRESLMPGMLWLQYRLWRNKAHVLKSGAHTLPLVEFRGAPSFLLGSAPAAPAASAPLAPGASAVPDVPDESDAFSNGAVSGVSTPAAGPGVLPFLSVSGFCDDSGEACDDGRQSTASSLSELMEAGASGT